LSNLQKNDFVDWGKFIFSDESKFNLHGADGNRRIWCQSGTQLNSENIQTTKKFGGGNIMVWGCITQFGIGKILRVSNKINSEEYFNTLRSGLIETYTTKNLKPSEYIFQRDNASCHTCAITLNWLNTKNKTMKWPSNSPDLNLIENVWAYLNKKVRARSRSSDNPENLWKIVEEEWYKIPQKYIFKLYFSMCSIMKSLEDAKGINTKY
jgi:hypothetical protein